MQKKILFVMAVVLFVCLLAGCDHRSVKYVSTDADYIEGGDNSTEEQASEEFQFDTTENWKQAEELVPVYVCGAVTEPGVYYVSSTGLKADALNMAGGFVEGASLDYVNLAETVVAGEKIYFPYEYEVCGGNLSQDSQSNKVNINTATKEELMTLPGIGESKAEAIIKYREEYGPFQNIEDITNITGIKEGVYDNIKDFIIVN